AADLPLARRSPGGGGASSAQGGHRAARARDRVPRGRGGEPAGDARELGPVRRAPGLRRHERADLARDPAGARRGRAPPAPRPRGALTRARRRRKPSPAGPHGAGRAAPTKRRSMRSLSHHAQREWRTTRRHRRSAFPSAVARSERKLRWGAYRRGAPSPNAARRFAASTGPWRTAYTPAFGTAGPSARLAQSPAPQTGLPSTARSVPSTRRNPRASTGRPPVRSRVGPAAPASHTTTSAGSVVSPARATASASTRTTGRPVS